MSAFDLLEPFQKALIVGVPGAFTPACSSTHVPSFIKNFDALKSKGVDKIVCVSVNDGFVMSAWSETLKAGSKVSLQMVLDGLRILNSWKVLFYIVRARY